LGRLRRRRGSLLLQPHDGSGVVVPVCVGRRSRHRGGCRPVASGASCGVGSPPVSEGAVVVAVSVWRSAVARAELSR
jgi:hypothetical protein